MKLLITGGAGFAGSNFIRFWLKNHPEDKILNLDKLTYAGNLENLREVEKNPRYEFIKGDICDPYIVEEAMEKVDWVVNFAAETHVDRSIKGPAVFIQTNVIGTQVLLDIALKEKIKRFVHISTDEVFGDLPLSSKEKFNEKTSYDPHSPYSSSKAASDHLVRAYYHTYNLPVAITNSTNFYGPYQFPEKFIPRMITKALDNQLLPIYGKGFNVRDWLHVEDQATAIEVVLEKGKIGETYCVGGESEKRNIDVARLILKILDKDESLIFFAQDRSGHDRRYAMDISKIKKELKWKPKYKFEEGLRETVSWYQQNEWWWRPLKEKAESIYYEDSQTS
jgi:dTDP-glucose 4,6-dehydratase